MNAEGLLRHFGRVSEAPGAVPRLRRFVLDLAVRGRLVEQDSDDEPVGELLERIAEEKQWLVKKGKIRKSKTLEPIDEGEVPFEIPDSWAWSRLFNVTAYIQRGKSPKYASGDGPPVISQRCVQWDGLHLEWAKAITSESLENYEDVRFLKDNDLLWNSTGTGTIGRIIRLSQPIEDLVCDSHVTVVRPVLMNSEYVRSWLRSDHVYGLIESRASGSTNQVELTATLAKNQVTPVPPFAEQHRIVAKVDELMALCDELEAAQTAREKRRDRLVAAVHHRLGHSDDDGDSGDGFKETARFFFNHLPRLTVRADHVGRLRRTILNLAVRGRLVGQEAGEEPAATLLSRIDAEGPQGGNSRGARQEENPGEGPLFKIPDGWVWSTTQQLTQPDQRITYGILKPVWVPVGVPTVRVTEMKTGTISVDSLRQCDQSRAQKFAKTRLSDGDLLISKDGTIGKTAFVPPELAGGNITQHVLRFSISRHLNRWFIRLCIDSPVCQSWMAGETKGVALKGVNVSDFRRMPVPVPPLAEQDRIVARVSELMAILDELETGLTTAVTTHRRLLESVLWQILQRGENAATAWDIM